MKKTILLLLLFSSLLAQAQDDSTKIYVKNISLQARDVEALTPLFLSRFDLFEDIYDLAKVRFKGNPNATTQVSFDSLRIDALLEIARYTLDVQFAFGSQFSTRVQGELKKINHPFFVRLLAAMEDNYTERYQAVRQEGRKRLRGVRN